MSLPCKDLWPITVFTDQGEFTGLKTEAVLSAHKEADKWPTMFLKTAHEVRNIAIEIFATINILQI